jgi:hypothetical protein
VSKYWLSAQESEVCRVGRELRRQGLAGFLSSGSPGAMRRDLHMAPLSAPAFAAKAMLAFPIGSRVVQDKSLCGEDNKPDRSIQTAQAVYPGLFACIVYRLDRSSLDYIYLIWRLWCVTYAISRTCSLRPSCPVDDCVIMTAVYHSRAEHHALNPSSQQGRSERSRTLGRNLKSAKCPSSRLSQTRAHAAHAREWPERETNYCTNTTLLVSQSAPCSRARASVKGS